MNKNDAKLLRPEFAWLIGDIEGRGYLKIEYSAKFLKYLKLYSGNAMDDEIEDFFKNYIFGREQAHPWAFNSLFASLTRLILDNENYDQPEKWQSQLKAEFNYTKSGVDREERMFRYKK